MTRGDGTAQILLSTGKRDKARRNRPKNIVLRKQLDYAGHNFARAARQLTLQSVAKRGSLASSWGSNGARTELGKD
jgi:hypothetical protein